ncbi:hypothetical protein GPJ81_08165 [Pseudomonas alkylphenolica]|uniref:Uncharacterized protein n=1 Tax=Pseudomonas alkylphenolica TaxID=237609 RepID=A0A6I6H833_9PSED|nr:hypothetical protein [Pseudomonas alkylphenolica]QGW76648.1 hypothetical protein GPJ81_08165 [Pseudomonas alkylphenolica]
MKQIKSHNYEILNFRTESNPQLNRVDCLTLANPAAETVLDELQFTGRNPFASSDVNISPHLTGVLPYRLSKT